MKIRDAICVSSRGEKSRTNSQLNLRALLISTAKRLSELVNGPPKVLIKPKSTISSIRPEAANNSEVPVDALTTSSALLYEARNERIAGSNASDRPNGDASIANIDRAG
jgi:hypothetical protein